MSVNISGVTNKDDSGHYSWEKAVADVNDIDESFATARDLGYTRLNYARVSAVSTLDKYDHKDIFSIQVQSNGKLRVALKSSEKDDKVLDLSKYEEELEKIKRSLNPLDNLEDELGKFKKKAEEDLFEQTASGMYMKVYMVRNGKIVLVADSTADKESKLYQTALDMMDGQYKAKKGNYYIETGYKQDAEIPKDGTPYMLQVWQGDSYKHDYLMTEGKSSDSKNKQITTKKDMELAASSSQYGTTTISAAYAAQIQAQSYAATATMLSNAYSNMSSITSHSSKNKASQLFSTLLNV